MFIAIDIKHYKARHIAFRNDFCMACEAESMAVQLRTFAALRLYWIPLVPLGFRKRWLCTTCGRGPHAVARTRRPFKVLAAMLAALMALSAWAVPAVGEDLGVLWAMRLGLPILFLLAVLWAVRHRPEPRLRALLARVTPSDLIVCPFCEMELIVESGRGWCPRCGVRRE